MNVPSTEEAYMNTNNRLYKILYNSKLLKHAE